MLILFRGMGVRLRGNDKGDDNGDGDGKKAYVIERAKGRRKMLFV